MNQSKLGKILQQVRHSDLFDIAVAFLVAFILYQGAGYALNTDMPVVAVVSDSMEPSLYRGDLIVAEGGSPQVGDIIIYSGPRAYPIIHRVVDVTHEGGVTGYVTKGDNNAAKDPWTVSPEQIHGKAILWIPFLGYPRVLLHDIVGV